MPTDEQTISLQKALTEERRGYELRLVDAEGDLKKSLEDRVKSIDSQLAALEPKKPAAKKPAAKPAAKKPAAKKGSKK